MVPCSKIARLANGLSCEIFIRNGDKRVDAKSVFDLMTLTAEQNSVLELEASGEGAIEGLEKLASLFEQNFEDDSMMDDTVRAD